MDIKAILKGVLSAQNVLLLLFFSAILGFVSLILTRLSAYPLFIGSLIFLSFLSLVGAFFCINKNIERDPQKVDLKAKVAQEIKSVEMSFVPEKMSPASITNIFLMVSNFFDNPSPTGVIRGVPKEKTRDNIQMLNETDAQKRKEDADNLFFKDRAKAFDDLKAIIPQHIQQQIEDAAGPKGITDKNI